MKFALGGISEVTPMFEPRWREPKRVDPPDCRCVDCLTGYSVPLVLPLDNVMGNALYWGKIDNATGYKIELGLGYYAVDE